ncbi:MAG: hypothetical protein LW865_02045 [Betaproteobacteria bacterium]|jgi:hypothetical protein|nr:hypothetical protein [Betaproteobacteria bacterium]
MKKLFQFWLPGVVLSLAATLVMTAAIAKDGEAKSAPAPARFIVIVNDSFNGDIGRSIANYIKSQTDSRVDVVEVNNGDVTAYPFVVALDKNGTYLTSHKGTKNIYPFIDRTVGKR